jgi:hypothetical protein
MDQQRIVQWIKWWRWWRLMRDSLELYQCLHRGDDGKS